MPEWVLTISIHFIDHILQLRLCRILAQRAHDCTQLFGGDGAISILVKERKCLLELWLQKKSEWALSKADMSHQQYDSGFKILKRVNSLRKMLIKVQVNTLSPLCTVNSQLAQDLEKKKKKGYYITHVSILN